MRCFRASFPIASGVGCFLITVILLLSYHLDLERHGIGVSRHFHFGFFDGGVWFYSDELPYQGSMIGIAEDPSLPQVRGGDFPGVYYRSFRIRAENTWTLMVSLWYPILLSAIAPAAWIINRRRLRVG